MNNKLNKLQSDFVSCLHRFVDRQRIVQQCMRDLRPIFLEYIESIEQKPQQSEYRTQSYFDRMSKESKSIQFSGYWGEENEWAYFLHGKGCRLVHVTTGEQVEWNASEIRRFDPYWFLNWLQWLIIQEEHEQSTVRIKETMPEARDHAKKWLFDLLKHLRLMGILSEANQQGKIELVIQD